ncbi:hypothetical protein [Halomicrococcus gelatinilyticus]|uniref:hypothetical protein n=1 Tax=Halomicrococcus gelatinilyticus TaxID=1702103 RepID=UPI002E12F2AA
MRVSHVVVIATLAIYVFFAIAATFQVVDPRLTQASQPPDVDFSDPPSDVVATSVTKLEHMDYSSKFIASPNESGTNSSSKSIETRVEHSDAEYVVDNLFGVDGMKLYANDATAWIWTSGDGWQLLRKTHISFPSNYAYPTADKLHPFNVSSIRRAEGAIVDETATQVVIRINDTTTSGTDVPGYTRFHIDKRSGNLRKAVQVGRYDGETGTVKIRFNEVGTTTVERPDAIGFSAWELVGDLMRYTPAE